MEEITRSIVIVSAVVGVPLNLAILFVRSLKMYQRRRMSAYQFCVCQLAIADLLAAITTAFDIHVFFHGNLWHFGVLACKLIKTFQSIGFSTSGMIMTIMAYERYQGIINPICHRLNFRRTVIACVIVWVYIFLKFIPSFMANDVYGQQCVEINFPSRNFQIGYGIFHCVTSLLIPLLLTTWYHSKIFLFMRTHTRAMSVHCHRSNTVSLRLSQEVSQEENLYSVGDHDLQQTIFENDSAEHLHDTVVRRTSTEKNISLSRRTSTENSSKKKGRSTTLRRLLSRRSRQNGIASRKLKVHILLSITICFFVMIAPSNVWYMFYDLGYINLNHRSSNYYVMDVLACLLYLHCLANGFIYSVADKKFRSDVCATFSCKKH